jgi:hypothetical protein
MKKVISSITVILVLVALVSFKSSISESSRNRSEIDKLFTKAKTENKELAKFEEMYLSYFAKSQAERIDISQKITSRERLHQQARSLVKSIRNETIKKHVTAIQNAYYQQFVGLKNKRATTVKPVNDELSISADWLSAMKIAYALDQNRSIEHALEKEISDSEVSLNKVKELNAKGKELVTKILTPAD